MGSGRTRPIPPRTVLKLRRLWPHARRHGREVGQTYRVGYYCRSCGTETIWLVGADGRYNWTADRPFVSRFFDVVETSNERSLYGRNRPRLTPLRSERKRARRAAG